MTDPFGRTTVVYDPSGPRPNGIAVAALVLGIVGLAVGWVPFFIGLVLSFVPTVLAILFGLIGLTRTASRRSGFVPSLLGLCFGLLTAFLWTTGYGVIW